MVGLQVYTFINVSLDSIEVTVEVTNIKILSEAILGRLDLEGGISDSHD